MKTLLFAILCGFCVSALARNLSFGGSVELQVQEITGQILRQTEQLQSTIGRSVVLQREFGHRLAVLLNELRSISGETSSSALNKLYTIQQRVQQLSADVSQRIADGLD